MAFNKYYQDELAYLREMGRLFSQQNPGLSKFLSEEGNDPDVERLFEGFAFLTGRMRQKLDDELPEVTHSLINLLWPHYLRPVPAMSILEFKPVTNAVTQKKTIARGATVQSVAVEGTNCQFRTCYDVDIYPLELDQVHLENSSAGASLALDFVLDSTTASDSLQLDKLRLFLHAEREIHISQMLYLWLFRYLDGIELTIHYKTETASKRFTLAPDQLVPAGFAEEEALLPYSSRSFSGYRYLQEYFSLPEKFLFVDLVGLEAYLQEPMIERFEIRFLFSRRLDAQIRIKKEHIRLYCTPVINLFAADADPVRVSSKQLEYLVRPSHKQQQHIELFSIDRVSGQRQGRSTRTTYEPFESFNHEQDQAVQQEQQEQQEQVFHKLRRCPSTLQGGLDNYISFVTVANQHAEPGSETVSLELSCSNRKLPETLRAGDIVYPTLNSPEFVTFRNITRVTQSLEPPMRDGLHWQLVSNLALHYHSMARLESLRVLLKCYDFGAFYDRQAERANQQLMEGIQEISTQSVDRLHKGIPVRRLLTRIKMRESKFGGKGVQGEGNMFLFASVLNGFYTQYATINSCHELEVVGLDNGETYQWTTIPGQRTLL
jgi:type VI secretion system protein ImpG